LAVAKKSDQTPRSEVPATSSKFEVPPTSSKSEVPPTSSKSEVPATFSKFEVPGTSKSEVLVPSESQPSTSELQIRRK